MVLAASVEAKKARVEISLFLASLTDAGLSWMLNPGQNPAGEGGGSREVGKVVPQESHNSSRPGPSGTNREVWTEPWLRSHERGLMAARISDLRLLRDAAPERAMAMPRLSSNSPSLLFLCLLLLSPFIPTTGVPSR